MAQQGQATAAQRVFGIPELLEEVLEHLDLPDLVRALHFTRKSKETILTTTRFKHRLEEALWRRAVPRHTWFYYVYSSTGQHLEGRLTKNSDHPQTPTRLFSVPLIVGNIMVGKFHPSMPFQQLPIFQVGATRCDIQWPALQDVPSKREQDFITQPPCTFVSVVCTRREEEVRRAHIQSLEGVRFSDVLSVVNGQAGSDFDGVRLFVGKFVWEGDASVQAARDFETRNLSLAKVLPFGDVSL